MNDFADPSALQTDVSELEHIKQRSRFLRGTLLESLANPLTGALAEPDTKLLKFHGSYQQDDRDVRDERRRQKLEPAWSFMIRARLPGGVVTPDQWLAFDALARRHAGRGLRITSRQTLQWHGVIKRDLKPALASIHAAMATTLAACGDVNRQVVSSVNPHLSDGHAAVLDWARRLSDHFLPRTGAWHEIWLDGKPVVSPESEPLYGATYLPRKFKMGIALPPVNDIDVYAQDLGLIAIVDGGRLQGFNVAIGGGMGATHGDATTYPRLASLIGFVTLDEVIALAEGVVTLQRDHGNRQERKHARLKYTIDRMGLDTFVTQLQERTGVTLQATRPFKFDHQGDVFGWQQGQDGLWHLGLHIESGRLWDHADSTQQTGVREIAALHTGELRMTCNQNLIIANVRAQDRDAIDERVRRHGLDAYARAGAMRRASMACVALPTCALAMAESERYLPDLLPRLEDLLASHGLEDEAISLRLSGCPNGCSRPYLSEIALVGRAPGRYDLRVGADTTGARLNRLWHENVDEPQILKALDQAFADFAASRQMGEAFGDFMHRRLSQ